MSHRRLSTPQPAQGFSLIELMIAVAVIGILLSVAVPGYMDHVRRSRAVEAVSQLATWGSRMEQSYLDNRNYGDGACRVAVPVAQHYTMSCALTNAGQGFTLTATAQINSEGTYTLSEGNQKTTTQFKGTSSSKPCWLIKGEEC
jgi:type IV pilus assembly protein PilE